MRKVFSILQQIEIKPCTYIQHQFKFTFFTPVHSSKYPAMQGFFFWFFFNFKEYVKKEIKKNLDTVYTTINKQKNMVQHNY